MADAAALLGRNDDVTDVAERAVVVRCADAAGYAVDFGAQRDAERVQPLPVARRVAPSLAVGQRPRQFQVAGSQWTDCGRRRRVSHRVPPHGHC